MSGDHEMQTIKEEMKKIIVEELEQMKMDAREEIRDEMKKMKEELRSKLWDMENFKVKVREQVHQIGELPEEIKSEFMAKLKEAKEDVVQQMNWTFKDELLDEMKDMNSSLNEDLDELRETTDELKEDTNVALYHMNEDLQQLRETTDKLKEDTYLAPRHIGPEWEPSKKENIHCRVDGFCQSFVTTFISS